MAQTRPLAPYKSNGWELSNAEVIGLFRQTTCSASASIRYNTLKLRKIYSYGDSRKIVKTPIVHHLLLLLLSSSVQTTYRETGISNLSISFTKIIYTGAYMILDAQNLHTFSPKPVKLQFGKLRSVSLDAICWFAHVPKTWRLEVWSWLWFVALFGYQRCSFVSVSLND